MRFELEDAMNYFWEGFMERIEVLIAELERLIPMSREFDVAASK